MRFVQRIDKRLQKEEEDEESEDLLPELSGVAAGDKLRSWIKTHFKQMQRPCANDRIVNVYLDASFDANQVGQLTTEKVQLLHHEWN